MLPTTGSIDTPIGKLDIRNGYPTAATTTKLFDEMDFQRAVQAYLWALPMIGSAQWQNEQHIKFDAGDLDYVDYLDFKDKLGLLTADAATPYSISFVNLAKTGPLVVEVPAGAIAGGIFDVWQRSITDTGWRGPENSQGGKFLILGPNDPEMKPEGYYAFRSQTNNIWSGQLGLDPDKAKAVALLQQFRNYPYAERDNPPKRVSNHVRPDGRKWAGQQPEGLAYWEVVSRLINEEPPLERDRMMLATLVPLGIEKGRPFNPDARQKAILEQASSVGELMARANSYAERFASMPWTPDNHWKVAGYVGLTTQEVSPESKAPSWFYKAVGVTDVVADRFGERDGVFFQVAGLVRYLEASKDAAGNWLDGGKTICCTCRRTRRSSSSGRSLSMTTRLAASSTPAPIRTAPRTTTSLSTRTARPISVSARRRPRGKPEHNWIKTIPEQGVVHLLPAL